MSDFLQRYAKLKGESYVENLKTIGSVAAQVIQGRHMKGMSQQQLADASDLSKSTITRIENGKMDPCSQTLMKISAALNIPIIISSNVDLPAFNPYENTEQQGKTLLVKN